MRALTYIVLFIIPFIYLLNSISTTAKSTSAEKKTLFPTSSTSHIPLNGLNPLFKENIPRGLTHASTKERTVTIHNKITKDMLVYYKAGENIPTHFSVFIDGKEITSGATVNAAKVVNNTLRIKYEYVFHRAWVTRKGSKEVEFRLPSDKKVFDLTFSWTDKFHMILTGAQPISIIKIY